MQASHDTQIVYIIQRKDAKLTYNFQPTFKQFEKQLIGIFFNFQIWLTANEQCLIKLYTFFLHVVGGQWLPNVGSDKSIHAIHW